MHQDPDFSKIVFLVVDDKPFYRDMIQTAVMKAGARDIKHAGSVEVALKILNRPGPGVDCIVTDWDIAPVGGLELLRMVRTNAVKNMPANGPAVILTANADTAAVRAAKALDVNGFAVAPLSIEKLIKTIAAAVSREWSLKDARVYAAVPAVKPSLVAPEPPQRDEIIGDDTESQARASHGSFVTAEARKHFRERALKNVRERSLNDVKPGAILARDLRDRAGNLLLKSGTELQARLIDRLTHTSAGQGESYQVWIGEWDDAPSS